jgi:hypothetical protein
MVAFAKGLSLRLGTMKTILFSRNDQLLGAVNVPAAMVLTNVDEVWKLVGEDLSLTTEDLGHGFCLELNYYDGKGNYVKEGTYFLTAWGLLTGESAAI